MLAQREPHHHLVYEDSTIRVLRVRVPAHDTTLLHEHDPDYFWVALGPSTLVNVRAGVPDATVTSPDLAVHYSFGKFAHIARNPGAAPFDNITVELLEPQTGVHNLCEPAVADKPLDCRGSSTGQEGSILRRAGASGVGHGSAHREPPARSTRAPRCGRQARLENDLGDRPRLGGHKTEALGRAAA